MSWYSRRALARRFFANADGSILPLFGLFAFIVVGLLGAALDYERAGGVKSRLGAAADSASLAAARAAASLSSTDPTRPAAEIIAEAEDVGVQYFMANATALGDVVVETPQIKVSQENGVWVSKSTFEASLNTTISAVLGFEKIDVAGSAEASVAPGFPVLDIAMCIDSTGSMTSTLDAVKANALGFFDNLNNELNARGLKPFPLVRVRMLYFKDYGDAVPGIWDPDPMRVSGFFALPDESTDFNSFVSPQLAGGGGDWAEGGLECLNEAMSSDWLEKGDVPSGYTNAVTDVYPLVVVWTDASSHRIAYPNSLANPAYPPASHMPRTDAEFLDKWNSSDTIDQDNKQLLFFGDPAQASLEPDGAPSGWVEIMKWPNFTHAGLHTEANTSMIEFLAEGIAANSRSLSITN